MTCKVAGLSPVINGLITPLIAVPKKAVPHFSKGKNWVPLGGYLAVVPKILPQIPQYNQYITHIYICGICWCISRVLSLGYPTFPFEFCKAIYGLCMCMYIYKLHLYNITSRGPTLWWHADIALLVQNVFTTSSWRYFNQTQLKNLVQQKSESSCAKFGDEGGGT